MSQNGDSQRVREMRRAGLKDYEIAQHLGISSDTLWREFGRNREPRTCYVCGRSFIPRNGNQKVCCGEEARKRWHEKHTRGKCSDCGEPLSAGSGYPSARERFCRICWQCRIAEPVDQRARQIEEWWADGLTLKEIAAQLGWSAKHVGVEINHLREKGYDLPYRHRFKRPRYPDQVPA